MFESRAKFEINFQTLNPLPLIFQNLAFLRLFRFRWVIYHRRAEALKFATFLRHLAAFCSLSHSNFTGLDSINGKGGDSSKDPMSEEYNPEGENTTESAADLNDQIDSIAKNVLIYLYLDKNAVRDRKGERNTVVQGFTKNVDFYSPDYEDLVLPDEKDFRRTLYWNPSVTTSSDGKAKVVFYNNGQCTDMELEAETVTSGGTVANTTVTNRK